MFCPGCGNPITSGGRFCAGCGTELTVTLPGAGNGGQGEAGAVARRGRAAESLVGRVIENKYRLEERIGAGGMGAVYRASRLLIGDEVAVKLTHADFVRDAEAERFRREAQAAARLKHPNAVGVYDFGVTPDGTLYLVMELVEGESLRQIIKARGALAPATAGEVVRQVCAALDEAHRRQIVHRDIKPDNIIVHTTPRGVSVKVLDFGVAKLRDLPVTTLTQTGSVVGTPHYMSPEQCLGEELDHRSDIYSAGVVLYEMLCGVVPFNSPISTAVIVQHVNDPPPPLREKNSAVSHALERAVLHALEKRREARPQTAGAFADEVGAALEGREWASEVTWDARPEEATLDARPADDARTADGGEATASSAGLRAARAKEVPTAPRAQGPAQPPAVSGPRPAPTAVMASSPSSGASSIYPGATPARRGAKRTRAVVVALASLAVFAALVWLAVRLSQGERDETAAARKDSSAGVSNSRQAAGEGAATTSAGNANANAAAGQSASAQEAPPGMARVAGGAFMMGRNDGDEYERPAHSVSVRTFFMDKYEVTCEDYARFLQGSNYPRVPAGWGGRSYPAGAARLPVTGVTWDDANAYARWAGKRLPTEDEWEFAARGTDGRRYPWGNEWRAGMANADSDGEANKGLAEVGKYGGASPSGLFDMAGNVWEWTASPFAPYPGGPSLNRIKMPEGAVRVVRGGSWDSSKKFATTTYRGYWSVKDARPTVGFRCAKDAPQ
jgi:eukaryotic-like serine/threonine-protein kinase